MREEDKFNKVIKSIPETERLALLAKFSKHSSNDESYSDKNSSYVENNGEKNTKEQNQDLYLDSIYQNSTFLSKIVTIIISIFTGKTKDEIILNNELKSIKKFISLNYNNIADFEREKLTNNFIKEIVEIPIKIEEIKKILELYFNDPFYYYGFLGSVIESSFQEKVLGALQELLPENIEVTIDFLDKNIFLKEKDKRLKKFFSHFDAIFLEKVTTQFNKFDYFLKFLNFPYEKILRDFFIFDLKEPLNSNNNCDFLKAEEFLSRFYRLLGSFNFLFEEMGFVYDLIEYSANTPPINKPGSKGQIPQFTEEEIQKLKNIFQIIVSIKEKLPFKEIFQYFKKNLLYSVKPVKTKIDFIDIYKEYKKTIINALWEDFYEKIKITNLNQLLNKLLKTEYSYDTLPNFTPELKNNIEKLSTFKVRNVHILNFFSDFLKIIYKPKVEMVINRILIDGIFKKDTEKSNLSVAYYTLTNFYDKIKEFDTKFNEEKELGKKINITLKKIASDSAFKASLINIVTDINEESSKILFEANECLQLINIFLKNLLDVNNPKIVPINNFDKIKIPGSPNPFVVVEKINKNLSSYFEIVNLMQDVY